MPTPRFLQIHTLCSYPGVLLNRDDSGAAKRLPYGGSIRTRVSSQCLKRHWRTADDEWRLQNIACLSDQDFADRSRLFFSREIPARLGTDFPENEVIEVVGLVRDRLLKEKNGGDKPENGDGPKKSKKVPAAPTLSGLETKQAFILTKPELDYLTDVCRKILSGDDKLRAAVKEKPKTALTPFQKETRKALVDNFEALRQSSMVPASVEAALFGRMVTSDVLANPDAAIHVAHAFTVHEQASETDYFTVVDDLKSREDGNDGGSAGIFDSELTSGTYYSYVVVDVPLLVSNLTGIDPERWAETDTDRSLAASIVQHLLHLIATVSPGAKKGSTAPYSYAQTMLVEAGSRQPRTLAAAFEKPIRANGHNSSIASLAEDAMAAHLATYDRAYGAREARHFLSIHEKPELVGDRLSLDDLAAWASNCVANAEA